MWTICKERKQKWEETEDSQYIYQNELDKVCFKHNLRYEDFKDLTRRIASAKIMCEEAFDITKTSKYVGCQSGPA